MPDPPIPAELAIDHEPEWASELDEAVFAGGRFPDSDAIRGFVIDNPRLAEWCMRKLRVLIERDAEVVAEATYWRDRIDAYERAERARVAGAIEFFDIALENYALAERGRDPKRKSVNLPSGTIETRRPTKPKFQVVDEEKVIAWAAENLTGEQFEQVVKTEQTVRKTLLYELLGFKQVGADEHGEPRYVAAHPATGEVVPGVHAQAPETSATAKPTDVKRPKALSQ